MYLQFLHYGTTNQLQKKFQGGSSAIETKQLLENLIFDEKKRFSVSRCGRPQGQKNTPSPKTTHNHLQNYTKFIEAASSPLFGHHK